MFSHSKSPYLQYLNVIAYEIFNISLSVLAHQHMYVGVDIEKVRLIYIDRIIIATRSRHILLVAEKLIWTFQFNFPSFVFIFWKSTGLTLLYKLYCFLNYIADSRFKEIRFLEECRWYWRCCLDQTDEFLTKYLPFYE